MTDEIQQAVTPRKSPRRRHGPSPTQRTLAECRKRGWTARVVEHWNPHAFIRQDLWGFDLIALVPGPSETEMLFIQTTTTDNASSRRAKLTDLSGPLIDPLRLLLDAGVRAEVWGWRKLGARGKRKLWALRRERLHDGEWVVLEGER